MAVRGRTISCLLMVGTVHRDPRGKAKLLRLLQREKPAAISVEISLYARLFRAQKATIFRAVLRENLKKIRALIRRIQNRGYVTLARVADYINRLSVGDESNAAIDALDSVNLMTVGNSITAVLSERVFTPEEKAVMEKEQAAQAAFMQKLMAAQQGQPETLPISINGFDFEDEEDEDDDDD